MWEWERGFFVNKEKKVYKYNTNNNSLENGVSNSEVNNTMNPKVQNAEGSLWISPVSQNEEEVSSNDRDSKTKSNSNNKNLFGTT